MKIRNKGSKIINIGTTILMPDASMDINEATLKLPAIQAFIAKGLLETDESEAAFQKAVEEAAARKLEEDAKVFSQKALKYDLVLVPGDSFGAPGYFRMARRPQRIRPRLTPPRRPLPQRLPTRTSKE